MDGYLEMLKRCEKSLKVFKVLTVALALSLCFSIFVISLIEKTVLTEKADFTNTHMKVIWKFADIEQAGWIPRDADVLICDGSVGFQYLSDKQSGSIGIRESEEKAATDSYEKITNRNGKYRIMVRDDVSAKPESPTDSEYQDSFDKYNEPYDGPWTTNKNIVFYFDNQYRTGFLMK